MGEVCLRFVLLFVTNITPSLFAADPPTEWSTRERFAPDGQYTAARAELHERIVTARMGRTKPSSVPQIIFSGGGMGVGKSTVIRELEKAGFLRLSDFIQTDPDAIKQELPEFSHFQKENVKTAATRVHSESTDVAEKLFERALKEKRNIIIDSTLADYDYFSAMIKRIRSDHPDYRITILHVDASESKIKERLDERNGRGERVVPPEIAIPSHQKSKLSVAKLKELSDLFLQFDNETEPKLISFETRTGVTRVNLPLAPGMHTMLIKLGCPTVFNRLIP